MTSTRSSRKSKPEEGNKTDEDAYDKLTADWWINDATGFWKLGYNDPSKILSVDGSKQHSYISSFSKMRKVNGDVITQSTCLNVTLSYGCLPTSLKRQFTLTIANYRREMCDAIFNKQPALKKYNVDKFIQFFDDHQVNLDPAGPSHVATLEQKLDEDEDVDEDDQQVQVDDPNPKQSTRKRGGIKLKKPVKKSAEKKTANTEKEFRVNPSEFVTEVSKFNAVLNERGIKDEAMKEVKKSEKKPKILSKEKQFKDDIKSYEAAYTTKTALHYRGNYHVCVKKLNLAQPLYLDKVTTDKGVANIKAGVTEKPHLLRLMPPMVCLYPGPTYRFLNENHAIMKAVDEQFPSNGPEPPLDFPQTGGDGGTLIVLGGNHRTRAFTEIIEEEEAAGLDLKQIAAKYEPSLIRVHCTIYSTTHKDFKTKEKTQLSLYDIKRLAAEDNKLPHCFDKTWFDSCKNIRRWLYDRCKMKSDDLTITIPRKKIDEKLDLAFNDFLLSENTDTASKKSKRCKFDKCKPIACLEGPRFKDLLEIEKMTNKIVMDSFQTENNVNSANLKAAMKHEFITCHYVGIPLAKMPSEMRGSLIIQLKQGLSQYLELCTSLKRTPTIRGVKFVLHSFTQYVEKEAVHHDFRMAFGTYTKLGTFEEVAEKYPEHAVFERYRILLETDTLTNKNSKFVRNENIPPPWTYYFDRAEDWYQKEQDRARMAALSVVAGGDDETNKYTPEDIMEKNCLLRVPIAGTVVALRKLDWTLAQHLRPDTVECHGISTFLVSDLSTQSNGQAIINVMTKMANTIDQFFIICINDTPIQLEHAFDVSSFEKRLVYIEVDFGNSDADATGYCNNVEFVTILIGGKRKKLGSVKVKSCVIKAKTMTDPKLLKGLVEQLAPAGKWVLDSVSGRTNDPMLLAKELVHSFSDSNLHLFVDVSFIPDYAMKCDGWYEQLDLQLRTINAVADKEIVKKSRETAKSDNVTWLEKLVKEATELQTKKTKTKKEDKADDAMDEILEDSDNSELLQGDDDSNDSKASAAADTSDLEGGHKSAHEEDGKLTPASVRSPSEVDSPHGDGDNVGKVEKMHSGDRSPSGDDTSTHNKSPAPSEAVIDVVFSGSFLNSGDVGKATQTPGTPPGIQIESVGSTRNGDGDVGKSTQRTPGTPPGIQIESVSSQQESDVDSYPRTSTPNPEEVVPGKLISQTPIPNPQVELKAATGKKRQGTPLQTIEEEDAKRSRMERKENFLIGKFQPTDVKKYRDPPFSPTTPKWQKQKCDEFNWRLVSNQRYEKSPKIETIHFAEPDKIVEADADGNCYFNCLSIAICGRAMFHRSVRVLICQHMLKYREKYSKFIGQDVKSYLEETRMEETGCGWGSTNELQAAADLFETDIYTYIASMGQWHRFFATKNGVILYKEIKDNYQAIYLKNSNKHYDLVTKTKNLTDTRKQLVEEMLKVQTPVLIDIYSTTKKTTDEKKQLLAAKTVRRSEPKITERELALRNQSCKKKNLASLSKYSNDTRNTRQKGNSESVRAAINVRRQIQFPDGYDEY